jgi:hypothetical protein
LRYTERAEKTQLDALPAEIGRPEATYAALIPMIYCHWAWFRIVALFPASVAAIGTLAIPVVGVFSSALILGEPLATADLLGLALVHADERSQNFHRHAGVLAVRDGQGTFTTNPSPETVIEAGQVLIAIGTEAQLAALAGFAVARSWRHAPRPVHADDLLPERALAGDALARATLVHRIYRPLQAHSTELLTTLWSYLDNGRSLEATARELFVHPNTVRYRLKRVSDVIGWDATGAREALILQSALIIGSMSDHDTPPRRRPAR